MNDLQKIGDVAEKYQVSSRTLRYYEEIGLLWSTRQDESNYRYYDEEALNRLEQIILLRKIDLSLKDIQDILASKDLQVVITTFNQKLKTINSEMESLEKIRRLVEAFLALLQEQSYVQGDGLRLLQENSSALLQRTPEKEQSEVKKEAFIIMNENTKSVDVRIIELKPMRVAYYRAESETPENDAWQEMFKYVEENGLMNLATTRYFGFNNPNPTPGNSVYGYEVWVTVPDGTEPSGQIQIKEFTGGLYAVTSAYLYEIGERWAKLYNWVKESKDYESCVSDDCLDIEKQWLEETISPDKVPNVNTQMDLYTPICRI